MLAKGDHIFKGAFLEGFKPKERLTVSQWADKYRILPSKTASEPGKWRTDRTPYLREIMDELSHMSTTKKVVFMKGAQIGATESLNNWIGYTIHYDPCTMMVVWPSLPDVKKNSKLRIDPLIEGCPALKEKISTGKSKDQKNTTLFKDFEGGALILSGANSASGLRSVPAKFLGLDETDGYPDDVEGEGDPISLVMARSRTFSKRKAYLISTPTYKGRSKIEKAFQSSDQRYFYLPCPHCEKKQVLNFKNLQYNTKETLDGAIVTDCSYFCEHCGEEIQEHHKTKMLLAGEWIAHSESETAGFHLSALYSPLGWYSWKEICQDWVEALTDHSKMVAFVNTVLGETFEDSGERPQDQKLYSQREVYTIGTVPKGVMFLTCAVDVQADRLEAEVIGWGRKKIRWSIEHRIIPGRPTDEETWNELDAYITQLFPHVNGFDMSIKMTAIDSGYSTQEVYNFVRQYSPRRVIAIKGKDSLEKMVKRPSRVDVKDNGKEVRRGLQLWRVGTNLIKSELYGLLQKDPPKDLLEDYPDGYCHFPQYDEEYFKQLTAEKRIITKNKKGFNVVEWVKTRDRNEILDLHVYNRAAASILGLDRLNESGWKKLENEIMIAKKVIKSENRKDLKISKKKRKKSGFW